LDIIPCKNGGERVTAVEDVGNFNFWVSVDHVIESTSIFDHSLNFMHCILSPCVNSYIHTSWIYVAVINELNPLTIDSSFLKLYALVRASIICG